MYLQLSYGADAVEGGFFSGYEGYEGATATEYKRLDVSRDGETSADRE